LHSERGDTLENDRRFRVVTYNIHRAIGMDRRYRPQRIVEILLHYRPDIVFLQEVDEGAPRSRRMEMARELAIALGFRYWAAGYNVSLREGRYGNATLSRFPIRQHTNIDLTIGSKKNRGCLKTALELGEGRSLEVFNLHLGLSAAERERQIGVLVHSKEFRQLEAERACLIGGDFNDWRSLLGPIFTQAFDFRCATDRHSGATPAILTYPSFAPRGGLDRIFYRGPLEPKSAHRCRLKLSQIASDHLPIIADFELLPRP
jgi:endonuclease/exonuclease/phosphatase family metal-dependent hydrolase